MGLSLSQGSQKKQDPEVKVMSEERWAAESDHCTDHCGLVSKSLVKSPEPGVDLLLKLSFMRAYVNGQTIHTLPCSRSLFEGMLQTSSLSGVLECRRSQEKSVWSHFDGKLSSFSCQMKNIILQSSPTTS